MRSSNIRDQCALLPIFLSVFLFVCQTRDLKLSKKAVMSQGNRAMSFVPSLFYVEFRDDPLGLLEKIRASLQLGSEDPTVKFSRNSF